MGSIAQRQALYFTAPGRVEVRSEPRPHPAGDELLVQTLYSAISPGTERLIYRGEFPAGLPADETIAALSGDLAYPLKYGYAAVGQVMAAGRLVDPAWLGRLVFAFNPHESHFVARPDTVQPLPAGADPPTAAMLPNMETAVSLAMDGQPVIGERVAVVGQGVVGLLLTSLLAQMPLADLVSFDIYPRRRALALASGATACWPPDEAVTALWARWPAGADLVYEVSGSPAGLDLAIQLAGFAGRVIIGSWYGRKRANLDLGGTFHRRHQQLISSQVSQLAPRWRGRWTHARRLELAWAMLARTRPGALITHRLPLAQAATAYHLLDEAPDEALQIVLQYET